LAWIGAADVKVGVVVAIQTALLSALAGAFTASNADARTATTYSLTAAAVVCAALAVIYAARATFPQTGGPARSMVFFGKIAEQSIANFRDGMRALEDKDLLVDLADQVHRNAEIASSKYKEVRKAIGWSFVTAVPWALAVGTLVRL